MPKALAIFAHPDDIEFLCAGTLALLKEAGWEIKCVTTCAGDLGSAEGTREAIRTRRAAEAQAAAAVLGGTYEWAGMDDVSIYYCPEHLALVTRQIRKFDPDVVITHSPDCYMLDHEETSRLVRMATFCAGIPLYAAPGEAPTHKTPALYYSDALEFKDKFGKPVEAAFYIDITSTFATREKALACHASQRDWLRSHHGVDEYLITNERLAAHCGQLAGVKYAEGFRQHLGHGYPQENLLACVLPGRLIARNS